MVPKLLSEMFVPGPSKFTQLKASPDLEAGMIRLDLIGADRQVLCDVESAPVGEERTRRLGIDIPYGDAYAGYGCRRGIGNGTGDSAEGGLRLGGKRRKGESGDKEPGETGDSWPGTGAP